MAVFTLGELLLFATLPAFLAGLVPAGLRGRLFALFQLSSLGAWLVPAATGALVRPFGIEAAFSFVAALLLMAALLYVLAFRTRGGEETAAFDASP